ncbi:hypothetical protein QQF64_019608 [Cirrhinus molitorella]|uniref:Uncharacterized protein n=1 Tax=Cirrhinus molitorella TaxID=172907 RepID=A0ABR3LFY9_9TELE
MFHRFHVSQEDRDYLRFLWWENGDTRSEPKEYRMKVHLFGAASSPGCANYGMKLPAPFLLLGKKVLQEMCQRGIEWDDPIPKELMPQWSSWLNELKNLHNLQIARCFAPEHLGIVQRIELHHFSDASSHGYGGRLKICLPYILTQSTQPSYHENSVVTRLIVITANNKTQHQGEDTLNELRANGYWVVGLCSNVGITIVEEPANAAWKYAACNLLLSGPYTFPVAWLPRPSGCCSGLVFRASVLALSSTSALDTIPTIVQRRAIRVI